MSIYLEFPAISAYPIYDDALKSNGSTSINEEDLLVQLRQEQQMLQDFIKLMAV